MVKFEEASKRMFSNVFVCRNCKSKKRIEPLKVTAKTCVCKKCGSKAFRPIKKSK